MTRQPIPTLRRRMTREQAIDALSGGVAGGVRRLARGPLRAVADVYVPFGLYRAEIRRGSTCERAVLGVDLVDGLLDLYRFDRPLSPEEIEHVSTRNCIPSILSTRSAEDVIRSRVKRLTYRRIGFLAGGRVSVDVEAIDSIVHVPYWAGFFGRGDAASLVVFDAIRRSIEGPKLRRLISAWLVDGITSPDPSSTARVGAPP